MTLSTNQWVGSRHSAAALPCGLFVLLGAVIAAQQPQRAEPVDVARVLVDARVVDDAGRPVLGLQTGRL